MLNGRPLPLSQTAYNTCCIEEDSGAVVCEIFGSGHIDAVASSSAMLLSDWGNNCPKMTP